MSGLLRSKRAESFYTVFFLTHAAITVFVDLQPFYPRSIVPDALKHLGEFYLEISGDPLVASLAGLGPYSHNAYGAWFKTFACIEAVFQLPFFFVAAAGIWRGSATVWVLVFAYATSTLTTILPCIATFLSLPISPEETPISVLAVTQGQLNMLLASYLPFVFILSFMSIDAGARLWHMIRQAEQVAKVSKSS
ncbi:hypothetical protein BOTBODRAFT_400937 [Botryobasidium botryosum FD-172 SS1]|uniref:Efficient mitochondria targeting-associated protein 19 n=1 Tax=Botryobasidium botryosum (strain FD-172 SS1) TaxID=930990 RepID=A0A067MB72_BOTB1|nr:hypothetical protein BOTBODRAFT_400937 [Botryobasidium botryosum FD-172 SS1]